MHGLLVIVPCGKRKAWDTNPDRGPTAARSAYTGSLFAVNKEYAQRFAERWVILSAKYGLIDPDFRIPGPYNVSFKDISTHPVSVADLATQVREQNLDQFETIVGLGGKEYRAVIQRAFAACSANLLFPFSGLRSGKMMQATKRAIQLNQPWPWFAGPTART